MITIDFAVHTYCNQCERESKFSPLAHGAVKNEKGDDSRRQYRVLRCTFCGYVTFALEHWADPSGGDSYAEKIIYHPSPHFRRKPDWYSKLEKELCSVLDEVYLALDERLFFIASTGTRTALDTLIRDKISDVGNFQRKVEELVSRDIIKSKEKDLLISVIEAGSASAHRGYKPDESDMNDIMDITEQILFRICIEPQREEELKQKAQKIKASTPKKK